MRLFRPPTVLLRLCVRLYLTPGWRRGLADYALSFAAAVPAVCLDAEDAGDDPEPEPTDRNGFGVSVPELLSRERAHISAVYGDLAGHARAPRTVRNPKNPALTLLWFLASKGRPLPPSAGDLIDYVAFLSVEREALGAITARTCNTPLISSTSPGLATPGSAARATSSERRALCFRPV